MSEERRIVVPGETIVTGMDYLPGNDAYRDGEDVVARRFGVADISGKHVKVIALSGNYYPKRGNVIIGTVIDISFNGWIIDFGGIQNAFLPVSEVPKYLKLSELRGYLDFGESVVVKVSDVRSRGIEVTMKGRGLDKLTSGMIIEINPNKVPRIIGKEGSMVKTIKNATNCSITVGQNGKIWIRGETTQDELKVKEIIDFIVQHSTAHGLTEKINKLFNQNKSKEDEDFEIIEEETDK